MDMPLDITELPPWDEIDTVLLDVDGTLLDLAFDTRFWSEVIPASYARMHGVSVEEAARRIGPLFKSREGTLDWYCIEFWSGELQLDIPTLKRAESERVSWLPGAQDFLRKLRAKGKRTAIVTNAHPVTLHIKDERVGVTRYVDVAYSSHSLGAPKEDPRFWADLQQIEPHDPSRTMFVDDSPAVLAAARAAGIQYIYAVTHPDSSRTAREHPGFPTIQSVAELIL